MTYHKNTWHNQKACQSTLEETGFLIVPRDNWVFSGLR